MKVLCIDGKRRPNDRPDTPLPKENEVYTVIEELEGWDSDNPQIRKRCYFLEEIYYEIEYKGKVAVMVYEIDRFIPISDIDETEYADKVLYSIFQTA